MRRIEGICGSGRFRGSRSSGESLVQRWSARNAYQDARLGQTYGWWISSAMGGSSLLEVCAKRSDGSGCVKLKSDIDAAHIHSPTGGQVRASLNLRSSSLTDVSHPIKGLEFQRTRLGEHGHAPPITLADQTTINSSTLAGSSPQSQKAAPHQLYSTPIPRSACPSSQACWRRRPNSSTA